MKRWSKGLSPDPDEYEPAMVCMNFRGETGAQSSVMLALVAFTKVPQHNVLAQLPDRIRR